MKFLNCYVFMFRGKKREVFREEAVNISLIPKSTREEEWREACAGIVYACPETNLLSHFPVSSFPPAEEIRTVIKS